MEDGSLITLVTFCALLILFSFFVVGFQSAIVCFLCIYSTVKKKQISDISIYNLTMKLSTFQLVCLTNYLKVFCDISLSFLPTKQALITSVFVCCVVNTEVFDFWQD